MILLLDNYDSFTYNLVDYFEQVGIEVKVFRNNEPLAEIFAHPYKGVVLSPGPETPEKANQLFEVINHYWDKLPLLGICLGHQALAIKAGANLIKAQKPMHGKLSEIEVEPTILFKNLPQKQQVVRYHSLIIEDLPKNLKATAQTQVGELMAFESENGMACGLQFHPEAVLTEYGLEMLRNWVSFHNIV